jgi:glycosyltransferase involved in cell wall biosynthesis
MSGKPFVVACIPAFNEEKTIAKVVLLAQKHVDKVVVCDDGSGDLTGEIAERLGAEVLRHDGNFGKGAALKTLFSRAVELGCDVAVTLDGDGQHDPCEIPRLVEPVLNGDADVAVGSRFLGKVEVPRYRVIGNKALNLLTNVKMAEKLSDTQCGFRAYSGKALSLISVSEAGIGVDSQILLDASDKGLRIVEVPVGVSYKDAKSSYNPVSHLVMVVYSMIGNNKWCSSSIWHCVTAK